MLIKKKVFLYHDYCERYFMKSWVLDIFIIIVLLGRSESLMSQELKVAALMAMT